MKYWPASTTAGVKMTWAVGGGGGSTVNVTGVAFSVGFNVLGLQPRVITKVPDLSGAIVTVPWGSPVLPARISG